MMAASRMSRIVSRRLTVLLSLLVVSAAVLAPVSSDDVTTAESVHDAELISVPRTTGEHVVTFSVADGNGDAPLSTSPFDLKKHNSNKKFQKFYPKTEADWNFKGEGKKTDVFIKDPKDNRLLRLISEGLIGPQDILPIVESDAITSSHRNVSRGEMSVTVQPEGMFGIVSDELAADSDEKIIMEKKKNVTTKERIIPGVDNDASRESNEHVKINLDGNAGVQSPAFTEQKDSIAVPAQKHISLSKGKESQVHRKSNDSGYEVISLNRQKDWHQQSTDEGIFDFVDSPLSNKNLVPAGTGQTSRINVKKGPNGQDYEYEYIYYYYEDGDETTNHNGDKPKLNDITAAVSGSTPTSRATTPGTRSSSTPPPRYTKPFVLDDGAGTRIKSVDALNEPVTAQPHYNRDKFRPDFRYTVGNSAGVPTSTAPSKPVVSNEIYWQFENNRFPGRQIPPQAISEQPVVTQVVPETFPTTTQPTRGRVHFNTAATPTTVDDSSFIVTAQPVLSTQPPRDNRGKTKGPVRQPGLEPVDSNSFRTHSTGIPTDYERTYFPSQTFEVSSGKSLKNSPAPQNLSPVSGSTKSDIFRVKEQTIEYVPVTDTERLPQTTAPRVVSPVSTETGLDNNSPQSTLSDNSLTTVYGAGLTDKAAHDLYAIFQQTQNEETVRHTFPAQEDRTTVVDEADVSPFIFTNPPTTSVFTTQSTTTTTTTTTTTEAPTTTTTTTSAPISSSHVPGRSRFRGSGVSRTRPSTTSTEAASADSTGETSEKPTRSRFQPQHRREPGQRISGYGRKGTSTTTPSAEADPTSSSSNGGAEPSTRSSWHAPSRNRFRGSPSVRSENNTPESQSTSTPSPRPNLTDRYNNRRRPAFSRTTTTTAPSSASEDEEVAVKQEVSSDSSSAEPQQSTTFRSIRNKINSQNSQARPLRPGPRINLSPRGRFGATSTTTTVAVPLDADTSGSADVPVEQRHIEEANVEQEDASSDSVISSTLSTTAASTLHPDPMARFKNRPKLRVTDKAAYAKAHSQQQSNNSTSTSTSASVNQNRKVNHLLPRKKQPSTTPQTQEVKEEKDENSPKPVTEEVVEEDAAPDAVAPKADIDVPDAQPTPEVSSTTENKLASLLASRRRNLQRKPSTLVHHNKQPTTTNEES